VVSARARLPSCHAPQSHVMVRMPIGNRYIATVMGYEPDLAAHWLSYDDFPGEEEVCDLNAR